MLITSPQVDQENNKEGGWHDVNNIDILKLGELHFGLFKVCE